MCCWFFSTTSLEELEAPFDELVNDVSDDDVVALAASVTTVTRLVMPFSSSLESS